jgi:hypothetical protein
VPEENMALVLSPLPGKEPAGLDAVEATNSSIITAIDDLLTRSRGKGERLYFFYASHGLTARVSNRDENALVADDFSPRLTNNSLALRSLWSSSRWAAGRFHAGSRGRLVVVDAGTREMEQAMLRQPAEVGRQHDDLRDGDDRARLEFHPFPAPRNPLSSTSVKAPRSFPASRSSRALSPGEVA